MKRASPLQRSDKFAKPIHQVTFASGFYMGRYEVTRAQRQKVMGNNPSFVGDDPSDDKSCAENCPVNSVSWNDAQEFVKKLFSGSSLYAGEFGRDA